MLQGEGEVERSNALEAGVHSFNLVGYSIRQSDGPFERHYLVRYSTSGGSSFKESGPLV
jgi:hypothetical protein